MNKYLLIVLMTFGCTSSRGQALKSTGGCEYYGSIDAVYQGTASTSMLVNGRSYVVHCQLEGDMQVCAGPAFIKLGGDTVGRVSMATDGEVDIPLDKFNLWSGTYKMEFWFKGTWVNNGLMAWRNFLVMSETGVSQTSKDEEINIYPIPAADIVSVDISKLQGAFIKVRLLNIDGREVTTIHGDVGNAITQISVAGLPAGVYLLQIETSNGSLNRKVLVAH